MTLFSLFHLYFILKVDCDTTTWLRELRLHSNYVILLCWILATLVETPELRKFWSWEFEPTASALWYLIILQQLGELKCLQEGLTSSKSFMSSWQKYQVKILLSKVQFNTSFTSVGPRLQFRAPPGVLEIGSWHVLYFSDVALTGDKSCFI